MSDLKQLTDQDAADLLQTLGQLRIKKSATKPPIAAATLQSLPLELLAEIVQYLDLKSIKELLLSKCVPQVTQIDPALTELTAKVLIPENIVPVVTDGKHDWQKTLDKFLGPIEFSRSREIGHVIVQPDFSPPLNPKSGTWMKSKAFIDGQRLQCEPSKYGYVVDFERGTFGCVSNGLSFDTLPGTLLDTVQYFDSSQQAVCLTLFEGKYLVHRVRPDGVTTLTFDGKTSRDGEAKLPRYVNNIGEILLHYDHNNDEGDGWPDCMGDQYVIDWDNGKFVLVKRNVTMWGGSMLPSMCPNGLFITHNRPMHWSASNPVTGQMYHDGEDMVEVHGYADARFCVYDVRNVWHVIDAVDMTIRPLDTWWDYSTMSERGVQYFEEDKRFEICQIPFHETNTEDWEKLIEGMVPGDVKKLEKPV